MRPTSKTRRGVSPCAPVVLYFSTPLHSLRSSEAILHHRRISKSQRSFKKYDALGFTSDLLHLNLQDCIYVFIFVYSAHHVIATDTSWYRVHEEEGPWLSAAVCFPDTEDLFWPSSVVLAYSSHQDNVIKTDQFGLLNLRKIFVTS